MKQALLSLNRSLAVCGFLLFGGSASVAQSRPSLEAYVGPAFLMSPREIFAGGGAFIEEAAPTARVRAVWRNGARLAVTTHTQVLPIAERVPYYTAQPGRFRSSGAVVEGGAGLRLADFWNLGAYLTPFVGLDASVGTAINVNAPNSKKLSLALGAEIGLQALLTEHGGPSLSLGIRGQLRPLFPPYTETRFGSNGQPIAYQRHEPRAVSNVLLVGWFWQLPAPRQRWHTPRYSEAAEPEDE